MAILSGSTLTDCYYIPSFIPSGTVTVFNDTDTTPTSWTKVTTFNDYAIRVVSGSVTNGGSTAFSSILTQRNDSITLNPASISATLDTRAQNFDTGDTNNTSIDSISQNVADLPDHGHSYTRSLDNAPLAPGTNRQLAGPVTGNTMQATLEGSGGQHSHGFSGVTIEPHSHPFTSSHNHTISGSHAHPGSSVSQDFRVYYNDVILATKT